MYFILLLRLPKIGICANSYKQLGMNKWEDSRGVKKMDLWKIR